MAMNDEHKQARLEELKEEYERLTREGIALIDACKYYDVEEIYNRRLEISKRIEELEKCISTTNGSE